MNWDDLRHFRAFASSGSLSSAARELEVEHATVSRRVTSLEDQLGVQLVDRRGRRWTLTREGKQIAAIAGRMDDEAQAIRRAASGAQSGLTGTVTISAPPALALAFLTAPLVDLQSRHPGLCIRIHGEARTASLDRSEADIAIRLSRPLNGDLMITKLGTIEFHLYATPAYLESTRPADWRFIGYDGGAPPAAQQTAMQNVAGTRPIVFTASSLELQHSVARAGGGVAALPDFMARSDAGLIAVDAEPLITREIWFAIHNDMRRSAPVQAILTTLRDVFARERNAPPVALEER